MLKVYLKSYLNSFLDGISYMFARIVFESIAKELIVVAFVYLFVFEKIV